jgi:hypothetical protein
MAKRKVAGKVAGKVTAKIKAKRSTGKETARRKRATARGASGAKRRASRAPGPKRQRFVASHHSPDAFEKGLRRYAQYRDLGIAAATKGLARAHVIKMIPPCDPAEVSKRHYHDVDFQMIYVLKGWIKGEYDGAGEVTMYEGSAWLQPPRIKHTVLDYSDDCELL